MQGPPVVILPQLSAMVSNTRSNLNAGFWYGRRPLWDIGMIVLSLGALVTSTIGMWVGFRRLKRGLAGSSA